ncbi:hypothetical protein J2800_000987 [Caulobacter rhizosphaerae]|uniref:Restriction endonuclease n=1 Tax=Caulobacter rhizosphaerae TaxID=2010972 RepID=A0ABU1MX03_9CAUL|nr:hypothetical protein [Caulobacter rhizosphaerae]MDR6530251.1 hypothetical protein [Caulobacter rhizosphaerae]
MLHKMQEASSGQAHDFLRHLDKALSHIGAMAADDIHGLGLFTAVRELDLAYLAVEKPGVSRDAAEGFWLLRQGLPLYVRETFERVPAFSVPAILNQRSPGLTSLGLSLILAAGKIQQGRRLAFAALSGAIAVEHVGETSFKFRAPASFEAIEAHEAKFEADRVQAYLLAHRAKAKETFDPDIDKYLAGLFRRNVYVFRDKFIGYDAHPSLDDYHFGMSYAELAADRGFDGFHFALEFGGVAFREYRLALAYFASVSRKHEGFCRALVDKHPDIRLEDIVTITGDRQEMIDSIFAALNHYGPSFEGFRPITKAQAETIYKVMSVRRDNARLLGTGHATVPLLIEVSPTHVIKSLAGPRLSPSHFLLDALRFNFPKEYDRNQRTRETSMQKGMRRILGQAVSGLEFRENINLKRGGKRQTDIDFVAIDGRSKTALLFQLKHQDAYGVDMQKRLNRTGHLVDDTLRWAERTDLWLKTSNRAVIASTLRLRKSMRVEKFRKVVIGRNFAHVLHGFAQEGDFAVATWIQFVEAAYAMQQQGDFRSLDGLYRRLLVAMEEAASAPPPSRGGTFDLGVVKFEVEVYD